jgi:hypothetical protein
MYESTHTDTDLKDGSRLVDLEEVKDDVGVGRRTDEALHGHGEPRRHNVNGARAARNTLAERNPAKMRPPA